ADGRPPQRIVETLPVLRQEKREKPAVSALALKNEIKHKNKAGNDLNQVAGPVSERKQHIGRCLANRALNPDDNLGGVQPAGKGKLAKPGQKGRNPRGHFAVERLQVADDGRESEKS